MKICTTLISFFVGLLVSAQSIANYTISINTIWNETDHSSVPSGAHWSPLAGATHKNMNDVLEFNVEAPTTNGIKDIAETGDTFNFETEVNTLIIAGDANQYLEQGFSPFAGNNSTATLNTIMVSEDFPLITLVSMVAPSPDWFIAVHNENLRSGNPSINNGWKDTFTIDVFAYDAGTDSSTDYVHTNTVTTPRAPISIISGYPIFGRKMATATFTYNSSTLSTTQTDAFETINIFPNPAENILFISNLKKSNINSIEIYTLLGKLNKRIFIPENTKNIDINLSNLTSGVYLLKLNNKGNSSKIMKLVVQ